MSKLKDLINQYCPNGVEYLKLKEVAQYIRGITYNKSKETNNNNGWKVLRANNIALSSNSLILEDIKIIDKSVKVKDNQILRKDDILICAGSGSKEHIGKVAYIWEDMGYTFGGFMGVIRVKNKLNSRFLFHILTGDIFLRYLEKNLNSSTINNLNSQLMENFQIPVPPLPVQEEIVRILDTFTELTAQLNEELTLRKKQYEYYRDKLLDFGKNSGGGVQE